MKGIILAGGTGSRLYPLTKVMNKHLLPLYDRPMIYYPIECLVKAGIDEVLLVAGGNNAGQFIRLLGNGQELGLKRLSYAYQDGPAGIAQAVSLGEQFSDGGPIVVVLGDNILEYSIASACERFRRQGRGAKVLVSQVANPSAYGVAELDAEGRVLRIEEKPKEPRSNWVVVGVYFYDPSVFEIIRGLTPSVRRELEITDVNNAYIERGELTADKLQGYWADAGENIDSYLRACNIVAERGANKELGA